jgi:hypothetical protein
MKGGEKMDKDLHKQCETCDTETKVEINLLESKNNKSYGNTSDWRMRL